MFTVGFGTGFFGGFGSLFSEVFPTKIRNIDMGTVFNLSQGVQFLTTIIIAMVRSSAQMSFGIFLATIFAILCGIWIWTFPETRGIDLEEVDN